MQAAPGSARRIARRRSDPRFTVRVMLHVMLHVMPGTTAQTARGVARTLTLAATLALLGGACRGDKPETDARASAANPETATAGPLANDRPACSVAPHLTGEGIGPLRVGMRLRDLPRGCAVRDTTFTLGEGMRETAQVVMMGPAAAVAITTGSADSTVSRVIVADSAFRTEAGVKVGSTMADLRRHYGRLCAALGEGTVSVRADTLPGVAFRVSADFGAMAAAQARLRDASPVPDSARVTAIWLVGAGLRCAAG